METVICKCCGRKFNKAVADRYGPFKHPVCPVCIMELGDYYEKHQLEIDLMVQGEATV